MEGLNHQHIPGHAPQKERREIKRKHDASAKNSETALIDEGLQAIYGDDRSDIQKVERASRSLTKILTKLVLFLAVVAIASYTGFFIFSTFLSVPRENKPLIMSIEAPQDIKSGERTTVIITYQNPRQVPLAALELDVNMPTAFDLVAADPAPTDSQDMIWTIGSFGAQSDGKIVLEGIWQAAVPSTTNIQVLAHYRPANFNADFSDIANFEVTTLGSTLVALVEGPETAIPGEQLSFTATISNTGNETVPSPGFRLDLPPGFILSGSTPALEAGSEPKWELTDLARGASTTITWQGSFAGDIEQDVTQFTGKVFITEDGLELLQVSSNWFVNIATSGARVSVVGNGDSTVATTSAGEVLRVTIRYENTGSEEITDGTLLLDFVPGSGIPILWDKASLAGGTITKEGIVFSEESVGKLMPGDKKSFSLSFPIKESLTNDDIDTWTITAFASQGVTTVQTTPLTVKLNAQTTLNAEARYYSASGAPLGEGPLPPKVGAATTYKVFWSFTATIHDFENLEVSATLPPDITWSDRITSSHGTLSYDEATHVVRWVIDFLEAGQGGEAEFSLTATPGSEDVDTFIKLLSASAFVAEDAATNMSVKAEAAELTSELSTDTTANGKGLVIE